ncbi:S26 family signal peptidase [Enterobacter ludwigii]|uniref:S26 family signal peptidase n=1 Tax=Enterobacter ludwigii TaxID=299767 RepID=UPI003ED8F9DF
MFAGKKSAQIREILISESAWEEMTCLFAPSLMQPYGKGLKIVDGIAGDTVSVDPEETAINGSMVGEGLALAAESGHTEQELTRSGVVPNGRLWMMGRTRYSFDSRYWGSLDESQIIGRAYPLW